MRNDLHGALHFEGVNKGRAPTDREEDARREFIARPPDRAWWDYNIIMWQHHTPRAGRRTLKSRHQRRPMGRTQPQLCPIFCSQRSALVRREHRHRFLFRISPLLPGSRRQLEIPRSASEQYKKDRPARSRSSAIRACSDAVWLCKNPRPPGRRRAVLVALPAVLLQPRRRERHRRPGGVLGFRFLGRVARTPCATGSRALRHASPR